MRMILDIVCVKLILFTLFLFFMRTNELVIGDEVRLLNFGDANPQYKYRLLALGLRPGAIAKVIRIAPLGCPMLLQIGDISLTLRIQEALPLEWERL